MLTAAAKINEGRMNRFVKLDLWTLCPSAHTRRWSS